LRDLIYNEKQIAPSRSSWDLSIEDDNNPDGRKVFHCSNCQVDCNEIRYQSLKSKNYQVCIDCFLEGRFPATSCSGDFLRVEPGDDIDMEEEWTDDEILKLLEGVDRFDDDWLLISEHVGTRSKEQCITKFLQLPINDEFLTAQLSKKELQDLPFGTTPNPVMTTIAFLAGHVNPGVGAAAAKTALKELMKTAEGQSEDVDMDSQECAFSKETMKKATTTALHAAVDNARKLASYEDQEIQHWTRLAVKTMVDKLSFKVKQYDELESSLDTEFDELEKQHTILTNSISSISSQHYPLHGDGPLETANNTEQNTN
jgi:SWI/SNF related-matrix-associated actin-dependent regulator of chromatin subfamily C